MSNLIFPILKFILNKISYNVFGVIKSRWMISIFIFFSLILGSVYTANNFYVYKMKKKYINLTEIKKIVTNYIKTKLGKAIELGILDFSLLEGITIEDIKISDEEDFSNNKMFFTSQRVDIKLSTIFSDSVYINNIIFYNSKIELDINDINTDSFFNYILEKKFPKIEFRNLNFVLKDGNREIIKTSKPLQLSILNNNGDIQLSFDDSYFKIPFTLSLYGTGSIDKNSRFTIDLRLNKFPINNLNGFINNIMDGDGEKGESEGFVRLSKFNREVNIEGDIDILNYSGSLGIFPGLEINSMSLNTKFSYFKETDDNKKNEIFYKRKISNPHFLYSDSIMTNKTNLRKIQINSKIEDFSKLSEEIIIQKKNVIRGKMSFSLEVDETGKLNDWFYGEGKLNFENFELNFNDKSFQVELNYANFEFDSKNNLKSKIEGKIFNSPFQLKLNTQVNILKNTSNPKIPFQYFISGIIDSNIENVYLNDFIPIYESIKQKVQDDIKERQEKMLPQSYIIESTIFKTYFEKLSLNFILKINNLYKSHDTDLIGEVELNSKFSKSNLEFDIYDLIKSTKGKKFITFRSYMDRKNPYYELKMKVDDLNWSDKIYSLCGSNFYSKNLDMNLSYVAIGNNFSDIVVTKNYNLDFYFRNVSHKQIEKLDTVDFLEILGKDKLFDIKGSLSGYGQEYSFRNLDINNLDYNYKGYSSSNYSKGTGYQFNIYGLQNGKNVNFNIIEVGNRCQIKK